MIKQDYCVFCNYALTFLIKTKQSHWEGIREADYQEASNIRGFAQGGDDEVIDCWCPNCFLKYKV
jgi:hypothetical protein